MKRLVKRLAIVMAAFSIATLLFASPIYAKDACDIAGNADPLICGRKHIDEEAELIRRIKSVLETVYLWVGILAVVVIVIGGINYMTSGGETEKIKRARMAITYSVTGLIITIGAFAITSFVINSLNGKTPSGAGTVADTKETPTAEPQDPFGPERYKVKSIVVAKESRLIVGQSTTINAMIYPDYATNRELIYKSDNPNIATVDDKGLITAKTPGSTNISVASADGPQAAIKVTIVKPVQVGSIKLSASKITIKKGKTQTITATALPKNAANKTLIWKSKNPKIATITQNGRLKGIKDGKTTITVSSADKTTTVKISVTVESTPPNIAGDQRNVKYKKRLDFRKETRKIINKHTKDFFYNDYHTKIKRYGGYTKYVKSLGGVFEQHANDKKIKVKTAADFQEAFEYVWGLFTIWGPDYGGGGGSNTAHWNWGGGNGTSDGFYVGQPNRRSYLRYDNSAINDMLRSSANVRTGCNVSLSTFFSSTTLTTHGYGIANAAGQLQKHFKKITYVDDLQVGDLIGITKDGVRWSHTFIIGEVYKDYVVAYEGGSRFITTRKFKKLIKREHTKTLKSSSYSSSSKWFAVRVLNLDQSKTLAGLND